MRAPARSATVAAIFLGGTIAGLALSAKEPRLAAATNQGRADLDGDGLSDQQELVIGTLPYRADTDADGFSDLEERARGSDPRNAFSLPDATPFSVGTCASVEDGIVTMLSAVYLDESVHGSVALEIGVVYGGHVLRIAPRGIAQSRGFLYRGQDQRDTLAVFEIPLAESTVRRLHQVNLFAIVRGTTPGSADPVASVLPLVDFSGVTVAIERRNATFSAFGGGSPTGVVYRPLAGDDRIPSTWTGGEICFQRTTAVGMNGVSVVHEVESADCQPMDTYCSPGDCAAGVGLPLELPDPAALTGG